MSNMIDGERFRIKYSPQQGDEIACQNAFGLVFYLRPVYAASASATARTVAHHPPPTPRVTQEWVKCPPVREERRGFLKQLIARVLPLNNGEYA